MLSRGVKMLARNGRRRILVMEMILKPLARTGMVLQLLGLVMGQQDLQTTVVMIGKRVC